MPPAAEEAGWKDTVRVGPLETVRVIARFEDYAGRFAYHCHILEHEDHAMMRQFETVAAPAPDGGAVVRDAGSVDAAAAPDGQAPDEADAGCGCRAGTTRTPSGAMLVLVLGLVLRRVVRRRAGRDGARSSRRGAG